MPYFCVHDTVSVFALTRTTYRAKVLVEQLGGNAQYERIGGNYPEDAVKRERAIRKFQAQLFSRALAHQEQMKEAAKAAGVTSEEWSQEEQDIADSLQETVAFVDDPEACLDPDSHIVGKVL